MVMKDSRFETLDSWRGICAILVVVFHYTSEMPSAFETSAFVRNSYLFVDFFFVLSGFVLCHSYRGKITSLSDLGRFVLRRFGRVWPLHAVVLAGLVAVMAWVSHLPHPAGLSLSWNSTGYSIDALLPNMLLLNAMNLQGTAWNGPAWSIGAEFYVYLLFALLVIVAGRRLILPSLCLSIAALALVYRWAPDLMNTTWDYGIIRCIAGFFGGVAAYHVYHVTRGREPLPATLLELAAVTLVVLFVTYAGEDADHGSLLSLAAPVVFGAAVIVFAGERGFLSLALRARPFRALGRYSFSIYMIHMPLLVMLCYGGWSAGYYTKAFQGPVQPWTGSVDLVLIDFVLAVVLIAAASYRFIELPARRGFNRLADGGLSGLFARKRRLAFD
jgi:peptidoglycan/LPS O-acetylase OafA/YrhL